MSSLEYVLDHATWGRPIGWVTHEVIGQAVVNARSVSRLDIYREAGEVFSLDDNGPITAADFGLPEKEEYVRVGRSVGKSTDLLFMMNGRRIGATRMMRERFSMGARANE